MIYRCINPQNAFYKNYGGRGIKVCERWLDSTSVKTKGRTSTQGFENFLEDMGSTWFSQATIDRINNDGDYTPENCQWLTRSDNSRKMHVNNRSQRMLEINQRRLVDGTHHWLKQNRNPELTYGFQCGGFHHTDENIEKIRAAALNRKRCVCEICGKDVSVNIYSRFHGPKCRWKNPLPKCS